MLAYYKRQKSLSTNNADCNFNLSDREKAGLQYKGEYVLQKVHNKHKAKALHESQQTQAVLKAGKSSQPLLCFYQAMETRKTVSIAQVMNKA